MTTPAKLIQKQEDEIKKLYSQLSAQKETIKKMREALGSMKIAAGMFDDYSHGNAEIKYVDNEIERLKNQSSEITLCRSQYAHASKLYQEAIHPEVSEKK